MAPPLLALAILFLSKKAAAVAMYKAGARYGWPRVYRRALEYNRRLTRGRAAQRAVAANVAALFRFPSAAAAEAAARAADVREYVLAAAASMERNSPLLRGRLTALAGAALDAPATWWGWATSVGGGASKAAANASSSSSGGGGDGGGGSGSGGTGSATRPPLQ